jgi:RIO-like serine/threonine protein kinase
LTSVVQTDVAAAALSGGVLLHAFTVYTTGNVTVDLSPYNIVVSPGSTLTVAAKVAVSGASDIVSATLSWSEDC